jgi:hypothetical protein
LGIDLLQGKHLGAKQIGLQNQVGYRDILVYHRRGYTGLPSFAPVQNSYFKKIFSASRERLLPKKGRRNPQEDERETSDDFVSGQRFRAGVEGSISVLKRAFKLGCCLFKGFTHYAASVGLAVLCHNLVLLTRL